MRISMIVAYAKNHVIGYQGKIPWSIKGEQKRFRALTTGHTVIMGRRTYEEINRPLPNRQNIIISNSLSAIDGCLIAKSLEEALSLCKNEEEVFLIGGNRLYEEGMKFATTLYVTEIDYETKGDTFFPEIKPEEFKLVESEFVDGTIPYTYHTYQRLN